MIKTMILLTVLLNLVSANEKSYGQQFSKSELSVIKPSQVIQENYVVINLSKDIIDNVMANRFDVNNPYTYLQVVNDASTNKYHILFQTDFNGKILFLSYSSNLSMVFNKQDKPMFLFTRCLRDINNHISSVQVMDGAVKCILDRLNYCAGD